MRFPVARPDRPPPPSVLTGRCWVIDGDTIVIGNTHIRLAGIDAPELDHPWGQQSKWAMVRLCKGQTISAHIKPEMSYDRVVAQCFLPDGRDLAAELVTAGLALDWPKFSGGKYRHLEPADARRKLWRTQLRQRGLAPPPTLDLPGPDMGQASRPPFRPQPVVTAPTSTARPRSRNRYSVGWLVASGVVLLLVGCSFLGGKSDNAGSTAPAQRAAALGRFAVTAGMLNVRDDPTTGSEVIAQLAEGAIVLPQQRSGAWFAIVLPDGRIGWVHGGFLDRVGN